MAITNQFELDEPAAVAGGRLPSLTGMRWLAAAMVFAVHAAAQPGILPEGRVSETLTFVVGMGGYVGVSFFFVLSGFVLTWSMRAGDTARRFWRRRFFKIYPNHLVTFLVAIAMVLAGTQINWTGAGLTGVVPNLLLVHAWSPDPAVSFGVNDVSWSLSVEALFYLSFPLLIAGIGRIGTHRLWYWTGGVIVAVFCVPLLARLLPAEPQLPWEPMPAWQYWFVYVFPVTRMLEFALGILLARIVRAGIWPSVPRWAAASAFAAGYTAALFAPGNFGIVAATVIPLALLIPAAAVADVAGRRSFLARPVMVWLGNISFAFYLLHELVLKGMYRLAGTEHRPTALSAVSMVALALAVTVLLSWLLFAFVETPVLRRFGRARRLR
ncbi:acyltransferase family protein [Amycolatopsis sp. NPDC059027]|uniref:acyltransferase family protein n=1 Tax=Amycolatopsis sp. NPDC059027 TaxID=3346709 RepID=UPI00366C25EC